ncbi:uncharacterized protein METZ01_LOCUS373050, partial [marine metagenome]
CFSIVPPASNVVFNVDDGKAVQLLAGGLTFSGFTGGAVAASAGTVEFYRTNFLNNGSGLDGGGITFGGDKLTLNSCTFNGNGGAIKSLSPVIVLNSWFFSPSDKVFLDPLSSNNKNSALINNDIRSNVELNLVGNAFHYNVHLGSLSPANPNTSTTGALSSKWPAGVSKFDAGRSSGGFWERHFRKDKGDLGGDGAVDDGPLESSSRKPGKFGISGFADLVETMDLPDGSVTYDGGWFGLEGKPTVTITPKSTEVNALSPELFIPEDLDVTIESDLSNFPGVDIEKILVDNTNVTSTKKFLA